MLEKAKAAVGLGDTALDRVKGALAKKAQIVQRVLASPDGKELLELLEKEFLFGELYDPNPYRTHYNLGARDVVAYLRQLANFGENANGR
jgi:hypothetical protein